MRHFAALDRGGTLDRIWNARGLWLGPLAVTFICTVLLGACFYEQLALTANPQAPSVPILSWLVGLGVVAAAVLTFGSGFPVPMGFWRCWSEPTRVSRYRFGLVLISLACSGAASWLVYTGGSHALATVLWLLAILVILVAGIEATALGASITALRRLSRPTLAVLSRSRGTLAFLLILGVAAALRLPNIATVPGFVHFDEANNGLWGRAIARGQVDAFSYGEANLPITGFAWAGTFLKLFGDSLFSLRLSSAVLGIGSLVIVALLGRELFSTRTGVLAAGFLGLAHVHIHFSRTGHFYMQALFANLLTFYLVALALRSRSRLAAVGAGLLLDVDTQVYFGARVALIIVPLFIIYLALVHRRERSWARFSILGWIMVSFIVGFAPMGAFIAATWQQFTERTRDILVFGGSLDVRQHVFVMYGTHDDVRIFFSQLWRVMQTFNWSPNTGDQYQIVHPLLDPVSAALLPAAIAYALLHPRHPGFALCLIAFCSIVVVGGVLTVDPPFWPRLIEILPIVTLLLGALVDGICQVIDRAARHILPALLLSCALLIAVGYGNYKWYFNEFAPTIRQNFISSFMDIGLYVRSHPRYLYVYGLTDGTAWVDYEPVRFLTPGVAYCNVVQGIDLRQCSPNPVKRLLFIIFPNRDSLIPALERAYPAGTLTLIHRYDEGQRLYAYQAVRSARSLPNPARDRKPMLPDSPPGDPGGAL